MRHDLETGQLWGLVATLDIAFNECLMLRPDPYPPLTKVSTIDPMVPSVFSHLSPPDAVYDFHMAFGDKSGYAHGHFAASGWKLFYNRGDET